ncbi:MAG: hypothetical protein ACRD0K_24580 [Egibacteraceae bacterium]
MPTGIGDFEANPKITSAAEWRELAVHPSTTTVALIAEGTGP